MKNNVANTKCKLPISWLLIDEGKLHNGRGTSIDVGKRATPKAKKQPKSPAILSFFS